MKRRLLLVYLILSSCSPFSDFSDLSFIESQGNLDLKINDLPLNANLENPVTWQIEKNESLVTSYEVSIGTSAKSTDVAYWRPVGTSKSLTLDTQTLALLTPNTKYYINVRAQLNNNSTSATYTGDGFTTPAPQTSKIMAGLSHVCASSTYGDLKCWGDNTNGQLGYNDTTQRGDTAGSMAALRNIFPNTSEYKVKSVMQANSSEHTCVIFYSGKVKCWGKNTNGELGLGHTNPINPVTTPPSSLPYVDLGTNETAQHIVGGIGFTCALLTSGQVKCWGANGSGQLGLDSTTPTNIPTTIVNLGMDSGGIHSRPRPYTAKFISAGQYHVCIIRSDDSLFCWGDNFYGQLAQNNTINYGSDNTTKSLLSIQGSPVYLGPSTVTAKTVTTGGYHTCVVLNDTDTNPLTTLDGQVKCWGNGQNGQIGYDAFGVVRWGGAANNTQSTPAVQIGTGRKALSMSSGRFHTCALLDNNQVKCWGSGGSGRLGYEAVTNISDRVSNSIQNFGTVNLGTGLSANYLVSGGHYNCTIINPSGVKCWGAGGNGRLGTDTTNDVGGTVGSMGNNLPYSLISW